MATLTTTLSTGSSRVYPGSTVTVQTIVKVSGTETDAPGISFKWNIGSNGEKTASVTKTATGTYTADIVLPRNEFGLLDYRWDTDGALDSVDEGSFLVETGRFMRSTATDYST